MRIDQLRIRADIGRASCTCVQKRAMRFVVDPTTLAKCGDKLERLARGCPAPLGQGASANVY